MGCADCAGLGYGLLQQEYDGDAEEAGEREIAEVVYIRPEARLLVHDIINYSQSAIALGIQGGAVGADALIEERGDALHLLLVGGAGWVDPVHHVGAVYLLVSRDDGVYDRNTDASTDVSQKVIESTGIANFFVTQACHGGSGERNEDASGTESAQSDG